MRPMTLCLTFDDGLLAQAKVAAPLLEKYGWRGVFTVPTEILSTRQLTAEQAADLCLVGNEDKLMSWDDVRNLMARGHTCCPHTCSHADLAGLMESGRIEDVRREICDSKAQFIQQTGVVPQLFCLPHSRHSPRLDAMIRAEGMEPINGGGHWRPNVGEYAPNGESISDIGAFLRRCYANGCLHIDVVAHGIVREEGGWMPFEDAVDFDHFLAAIQEEVVAGRVSVVDYMFYHGKRIRFPRVSALTDRLHFKLRQCAFRYLIRSSIS